jgi:type I restriction enzyme S subunit
MVKKGYKQTEIGVIPEDWKIEKLGNISFITKLAGFEYSKHFNSYNDKGEIIVIRGTNITNNRLDLSDVKTIPRKTSNYLIRSKLNKGDLVFAYVGTIGPIYLIEDDNKYHLGPNTSKITLDKSVSNNFIFSYFNSWLIKNEITERTSIGAQPSLSMAKIRSFKIVLPTLTEQKIIASVLTDIDNLITNLETLIAKKKAIKQGAMQQLLTGKKRLQGFNKDWELKTLDQISNIKTGSRNNQDKISDGDYPFFVRSQTVERINSYSYDCEAILVPGEGGIGSIFHYINGKFDVHQRVYVINEFSKNVLGKYVFLYIKENFGIHAMKNSVKATVDSLRLPTFKEFELKIPKDIKEQKAIVQILSDMDGEIETLETKKIKTQHLKQGMMQELLTGKTRLVKPVNKAIQKENKIVSIAAEPQPKYETK